MKALNEIKKRAKAYERDLISPITATEIVTVMGKYLRTVRRDIPRLCDALEFLLVQSTKFEGQIVKQILSRTAEESKDADNGKKD